MEVSKAEFEGYALIVKFLKQISARILKLAEYFNKQAERVAYLQYKLIFGERDDDIYIVTYPKSGTTLMQVILYCLTTDGKMEFEHIYDVSPWIRNDVHLKKKPRVLPSPRLIKSHDKYNTVDKKTKGRFIFIYRDGMDVAVSHYHQNKNYNNPNLTFEKYLAQFFRTKAWFKFCKSWFNNKHNLPIHYVKYENLLENKHEEVRKIVSFLGIQPSEQQVENAMTFSDFEYMKKHEEKFGQPKPKEKVYDQFIRKGKSGEGKGMFSKEQTQQYEVLYNKYLAGMVKENNV